MLGAGDPSKNLGARRGATSFSFAVYAERRTMPKAFQI